MTSETGHLRRVIVHTPGPEMAAVAPGKLDDLLFEDILFVGHARDEHLLMCQVFQKVIGDPDGVIEIRTLLRESFESDDARSDFVGQLCKVVPERNLQAFERELSTLSPDELTVFAITGASPLPILAQPLPNLLFTRDVAAVVGDHVLVSHPATAARARESIIMNVVLHHHPAFAGLRDRIVHLPQGVTFEGGDLLVASEDTVLIGHSERTSFGGVISVARQLFERTAFRNIIMVNLPKTRSCMHLDTVFTFTDPSTCVVFPPIIGLDGLSNVVSYSPTDDPDRLECTVHGTLQSALETALDREMQFVPCGGSDPLSQEREQWTDGANFFAIAPGVVIGYERNVRTFEEMQKHGYRVVSAQGFLQYHAHSAFEKGEKVAIRLDGNELSRGRGGPRCMTLPLARDPVL